MTSGNTNGSHFNINDEVFNLITNIEEMNPLSLDSVKSKGACKYALEVNKGWFDKFGISPGCKIRLKNG